MYLLGIPTIIYIYIYLSSENYVFDGDTYHYKDESGAKHKWNQTTNQWEKEEVCMYLSIYLSI